MIYCYPSIVSPDGLDNDRGKLPENRRDFLHAMILNCSLHVSNTEDSHFALPYKIWIKLERKLGSIIYKKTYLNILVQKGSVCNFDKSTAQNI